MMVFYALAGLVCVACAVWYADINVIVVAIGMGLAAYTYTIHPTSWRMNPSYAMVVLGIYLVVGAGFAAIYAMLGQYGAVLVAGGTTVLVVWALARVAPDGVRLMRLVFGRQNVSGN